MGKLDSGRPTGRDQPVKIVDPWNNELIWGYSGVKDADGIGEIWQIHAPRLERNIEYAWNAVAPTLDLVERFYTKNGLPIDKDPVYDYQNRLKVKDGDSTAYLHRDRESRFYATIGYDRGNYEILGKTITLKMRNNGTDTPGYVSSVNSNSSSGYLIKKLMHPDTYYSTNYQMQPRNYPYPIIRLAELYLNYAETYFEYNGQLSGDALDYFNKVHKRAGIPDLVTSWSVAGGVPSGDALREVIKLERFNELALESLLYFDIRRWKDAEKHLNHNLRGLNIYGDTPEEFYQVREGLDNITRVFEKQFYLTPIPAKEVETNYNIRKNPGWK